VKETKKASEGEVVPTLVEAGTRFDGLVSFRGAVRVEGLVVGEVVAEGTLWVASQGELHGRVETDEVLVDGCCEGEIAARERIELRPSARVSGRLEAPRLLVADGSLFDGQWNAGTASAQAREEPRPADEPGAPEPARGTPTPS